MTEQMCEAERQINGVLDSWPGLRDTPMVVLGEFKITPAHLERIMLELDLLRREMSYVYGHDAELNAAIRKEALKMGPIVRPPS